MLVINPGNPMGIAIGMGSPEGTGAEAGMPVRGRPGLLSRLFRRGPGRTASAGDRRPDELPSRPDIPAAGH